MNNLIYKYKVLIIIYINIISYNVTLLLVKRIKNTQL